MPTMRVHGVTLSDSEARSLVLSLIKDGSKPSLSAAEMVARGLANKRQMVGLTPKSRTPSTACPDNPGSRALLDLRDALGRDRERV